MKKQNKFAALSMNELLEKQKALLKQLVTFRVSMDPSVIVESGNIEGLRKDIRVLQRQIASGSSSAKEA
jgi:hypothetical protein